MKKSFEFTLLPLSILVLATIICCFGRSGYAFDDFREFNEGQWEFELNNDYFWTSANYLRSGGTYSSLLNSNNYKLLASDLGVRWDFFKNWSVYTEARFGYSQAQTNTNTNTNSEFNRMTFGTDFQFDLGGIKLVPDFYVLVPTVTYSSTSTASETSEADLELVSRLMARVDFWRLKNTFYLGYNYRGGGRSSQAIYGAGSEFHLGSHILGGELSGFTTAIQDNYTSTPASRETAPLSANATSAIFNTVNPELLSVHGWYKYAAKNFTTQIGVGSTITGSNSAAGMDVMLNLVYHFNSNVALSYPSPDQKSEAQRFNESGKDDVDQTLFQPADQMQQGSPTGEKKLQDSQVKPKARVPVDPRSQIDKELEQTQIQIELKSKNQKTNPGE